MARQEPFDVAVVDLGLPGLSGLDTLRGLKQVSNRTKTVVLIGEPSLDSLCAGFNERVFDYVLRPQDMGRLAETVRDAARPAAKGTPMARPTEVAANAGAPVMVGDSAVMRDVRRQITEVAPTDLTVLVRGETGTGKEVVSRLIHILSGRRSSGPFYKVSCPSLPEHLLESEMFGYEKGAFTGAVNNRMGRFEMAAGGCILLDEIGALSPVVQAKLLEVIESKAFVRVGGTEKLRIDARIVAATNADLETMLRDGEFRPDLLYRLNQYTIVVPPLRERREDIPPLVARFLEDYADRYGRPVPELSSSDLATLEAHNWPGNVRELENLIARVVAVGCPKAIDEALGCGGDSNGAPARPCPLQHCEASLIRSALKRCGWNQRQAARSLGLSYSALRRRMARHGIQRPAAS